MKSKIWSLFAVLVLSASAGFGLNAFLFSSFVDAGTSQGGELTVVPKTGWSDNLAGADHTEWKFTATTTSELASGDIIRFVMPTTTAATNFTITNSATTSSNGITLFKTNALDVSGASSTAFADGQPFYYGYVNDTVNSGTSFSITFDGINNAYGATTTAVWGIQAGTLADPTIPQGPFTGDGSPKFSTTTVETLVDSPVGTPFITGVTLSDTDTTGFGLDGRDFRVAWTPGGTVPTGMDYMQIYILPGTANLNTMNLTTVCGGNAATPLGYFSSGMYLNQNNHNPSMSQKTDSCGTTFSAATSYKAWIYVHATASFVASSPAASVASDTATDTSAPFIEHMSVNTAKQSTDATIYALINDDQTEAGGYAAGTNGAFFTLVYGVDVSVASSTVQGVVVSGNLYSFTVPSAFVATKPTFEYFLKANDASGNRRHFCALPPDSATYNTCLTSPFVVNVLAAGSLARSISGTVLSNGSAVTSAYVFAGGMAIAAVQTNGSGVYSLTGLPSNSMVDLTAHKVGYCKMMRSENLGSSDKTDVTININQGECGFMMGGGGGGDMMSGGTPMVMFSVPPDGGQSAPIEAAIRAGFNQVMDSTTINDASANSTSDNVYLLNNTTNQAVAGTAVFCASQSSPGCSALFSMENNVILFTPTANLATSTSYALVITEKVKSQSGQSVQGNRPAGGHRINFTTISGSFNMNTIGQSYGTTGQYMPPFVRSVNPAPGMSTAGNTKITVEFDQPMQSATINTTNIKLKDSTIPSYVTLTSATLDSTESRFVKLTPSAALTNGHEYIVEVYGAVANAQGVTMRGPSGATEKAFSSSFRVNSASDSTAPTLYAALASGSTAVPVNQIFEFGANEQLDLDTITTTNITMYRGATAASVVVSYDPSKNSVFVAPVSSLSPSTAYTITFGAGVKDQAGNAITPITYSYTTGSGDSVAPALREARCDDYKCRMVFTEPMNHDTQADANWANSVTNPANWTVTKVSGSVDIPLTGKPMSYNSVDYSVTVDGVAGLAAGDTYLVTGATTIKDLSENAISNTNRTFTGKAESSATTFGQFGNAGMFAPPTSTMMGGSSVGGGEFVPQGFGNYTAEQFAFGSADQAYPFNPMAGQDVNVFQTRFKPGVALATGDKIAITFPSGTTVASAALDTQSPFTADFNQGSNTVVTSSNVAVDTTERKVTITLAVTGTATANDQYTIDLAKITNPSIPKGPNSGGYTATLQTIQSGVVTATKTSMPYFIETGGSNTITVDVFAGSGAGVSGADGTVYLHGGGPSGPMEKVLTMVDGQITAVNGTAGGTIVYSSLRDGCYSVGTEPMITLGAVDYFGQMSPEPICVNGGQSASKNITLTSSAAAGASVPVTVKLVKDSGFGGKNIDIFAGGPGKYVVKTLSNIDVPDPAGYTLRLPANGHWNIGVGPSMPKGASGGMPQSLGVMPPPPTDLVVAGLGGTASISAGMFTPPGASFNDTTDTLTYTFATADKAISGTVKDGAGNALSNMDVFVNRQGFGTPLFTQTNASGAFSLLVGDYGTYEIGASKQGMPPSVKMVDVRSGGNYVDGKLIDGGNPFVIVIKKASYTISGKVLDVNSNSISGAPLFGTNATGQSVFGQSGTDGSYTLFVDNGTWTINVQMPPEKNDACGTFSKTVVVSGASQSSQNVTPTAGTCYTISGTITAGGSTLNNVPLFIEEWNAATSMPVANGLKRPSSTNSSGAYSVSVLANKTYRIGTWHPDYGEIGSTQAVTTANVTKDITLTADTVTFNFTNGSTTMNAMIELKDSTNNNKVIRKQVNGLASAVVVNVGSGSTYNYFVDVFGYGKYSGTVASTGGADAVTIDVSSNFLTIAGTIKDASGNALSGAVVNLMSTSTNMVISDLTDSNGAYEIKVKAGSYQMATNLSGYVPPAPANVTFVANASGYDFATGQDQAPLTVSNYSIEGTIYNSSSVAMSEGFVWATNSSGTVVSSPVNANGTYSLPVTSGTWTVKAVGPLHSETALSGSLTVPGSVLTGKNITLTADATRIPKSTTGVLSASTGGSINDTGTSGMKITVGSGVLETGSGNVTVNMEKGYNAPDSAAYQALDNTTFSFEATGDSSIKTLNGNAEIQLSYADLISKLPAGISESDLQLLYYSPERGDYVPVEGGFTVDTANNTVTGLVSHFTDFVLAYVPLVEGVPSAPTGVSATAASASQINLSWTAVSGATTYNVHRSSSATGTYSDVASTASVSYSDTGLSAGTTYFYKITATNGTGEGASSNYGVATTQNAAGGSVSVSYIAPVSQPAITATTTPVIAKTTSPIILARFSVPAGVKLVFTKTLKKGAKSDDVSDLQKLLAIDKTIYPEGEVTGYFGNATEKALQRFQKKYGIVSTGTAATTGYGAFGPSTRAKIAEVFGNETAATTTVPTTTVSVTQNAQPSATATATSPVFNFALQKGMRNDSVRQLQIVLNSNPLTQIVETGDGSPGHETEYFGAATQKAVGRFQELNGLAKPGDSAYGFVGPKTRAKLNELSESVSLPPVSVSISSKVETSNKEASLEAQISALMKQVSDITAQIKSIH